MKYKGSEVGIVSLLMAVVIIGIVFIRMRLQYIYIACKSMQYYVIAKTVDSD